MTWPDYHLKSNRSQVVRQKWGILYQQTFWLVIDVVWLTGGNRLIHVYWSQVCLLLEQIEEEWVVTMQMDSYGFCQWFAWLKSRLSIVHCHIAVILQFGEHNIHPHTLAHKGLLWYKGSDPVWVNSHTNLYEASVLLTSLEAHKMTTNLLLWDTRYHIKQVLGFIKLINTMLTIGQK